MRRNSLLVFSLLTVCALVVLPSQSLRADMAPFVPPGTGPVRVTAPLVIKRGALTGEDALVQAKLEIPQGYLAVTLGPAWPPPEPVAPPAASAEPAGRSSSLPWGIIVAGVALSLAAVSVVVLVRGRRSSKSSAVVALVGAALLGGWSAAQADVPPPSPEELGPQIVIEVVPGGDSVTLHLPE